MNFHLTTNYNKKTDEDLMLFIIKGKEKAFNELYKRYSKRLFLFFYQKLHQDNDKAQDLLQDLFLKIIEKAETFNHSKKFSTWIYSIAYNMCKNEYRNNNTKSNKTTRLDSLNLNNKIIAPHITNIEKDHTLFKQHLNTELNKLDEKHSLTFTLKHQDNLSIKEISEIMECSEGTVKSRLFYTSKKLSVTLKRFNSNNF